MPRHIVLAALMLAPLPAAPALAQVPFHSAAPVVDWAGSSRGGFGLFRAVRRAESPYAVHIQGSPVSKAIEVPDEAAMDIGRRIWKNECGGTEAGLTSWNVGETFASLGIGHFIWYPAGQEGPFEESFPKLILYFQRSGVRLPDWLKPGVDCPWPDRQSFVKDLDSPRMLELRRLLVDTVPLQARFIVDRMESSLPRILAALPEGERAAVSRQFYLVADHPVGLYALADYVNFKGEGVNPAERYNGQGWGLLQVLQGMTGTDFGPPAVAEFSSSAAKVLERRVANSPPERNEARWLPGWLARVRTYRT